MNLQYQLGNGGGGATTIIWAGGGPWRKPGRPLLGTQPKIRLNIMLDPAIADRLRALGNGNLSRGIEIAATHEGARQKK